MWQVNYTKAILGSGRKGRIEDSIFKKFLYLLILYCSCLLLMFILFSLYFKRNVLKRNYYHIENNNNINILLNNLGDQSNYEDSEINGDDNEEHSNFCKQDYSCRKGKTYPRNVTLTLYSDTELSSKYSNVLHGGTWSPEECEPASKLAIVIPYRHRAKHLAVLLNNIIPFLQRQRKHFRIFVVNQEGPEIFNRAALLNIGFLEASKHGDFDCYIFHDVDLIPEDWCNLYKCTEKPRHLAVGIDKFNHSLPYYYYCGGALAVHNSTMWQINGFTNIMYGWGGEDDDIYYRFRRNNFDIDRYSSSVGGYTMIDHDRDKGNPVTQRSSREVSLHWKFSSYDGLSSSNYTMISTQLHHLYTMFHVRLHGPITQTAADIYFQKKEIEFKKRFKIDRAEKLKVYKIMKRIKIEYSKKVRLQKIKMAKELKERFSLVNDGIF